MSERSHFSVVVEDGIERIVVRGEREATLVRPGGKPAHGVAPCRSSDQGFDHAISVLLSDELETINGPCSGYGLIVVQ
jgi:hypothetical protein